MEIWWWLAFAMIVGAFMVFLGSVPAIFLARTADPIRRDRAMGPVRWVHGTWALACVGLTLFLAVFPGGHPPAFVFAPFVVMGWVIGHFCIWFAAHLVAKSRM